MKRKRTMHLVIFILKTTILAGVCESLIVGPYDPWEPKFANRSYMKCPIRYLCQEDPVKNKWTKDDCCVCYARPLWEVPKDITKPLSIEYIRRGGTATVYRYDNDVNSFLRLQHNHGFLSKIPLNICNFVQLVKLDLQDNQLSAVGNISCLSMLDILDLSYNRIHFIGNNTFLGLSQLRVLNLSYNDLTRMEPSTITGSSLQIFHADLSHNNMSKVEFSNIISDHDFCKIDFSSNKIDEIVNTNKFKIDPNKTYQGGSVTLTGNNFTKFIDFEKLGITEIAILGKVISYGFIMPDMKWDCDCHMEPYLELAEDVIKRIWRDYFNISCWNPPEYRGKTIPDIVNEGHLDILICNLTQKDKCPQYCHCFHQPKERRTVVNCTGAGLTKLPPHIPDSRNITLIFKNNSIKHFDSREYLKNVSYLDFSENQLETISPEAIDLLQKDISLDVANNNLKTLPRALQSLDPCKARFGVVIVHCNCENVWIKDWVKNRHLQQCTNTSMYMCHTDNGLILADNLSREDICKPETSNVIAIILSILCTLIVAVSSVMYLLRYEIYLIRRKYLIRKLSSNKIGCVPKYDVFLSFNDENAELRMWVMKVLTKNLETSGYRIFVPCRDLLPGTVKEEQVLDKILSSKHYLVMLCDYYKLGGTPWTEIEFKYIWHNYREHMERNIIVINFDQLDTAEEMDPKLRAFVRLGYDVDFSDRKHNLLKEVKKRLGAPLRSTFYNRNKKTKFLAQNLKQNNYFFDNLSIENNPKMKITDKQHLLPGTIPLDPNPDYNNFVFDLQLDNHAKAKNFEQQNLNREGVYTVCSDRKIRKELEKRNIENNTFMKVTNLLQDENHDLSNNNKGVQGGVFSEIRLPCEPDEFCELYNSRNRFAISNSKPIFSLKLSDIHFKPDNFSKT